MNTSNKNIVPTNFARKLIRNKYFLIVVAILAIYTLSGFLLAPYLIKRQLNQYITHDLKRQISIQKLSINPYALTFDLSGFELKESDGSQILSFDRFFVNFEVSSLFRWAFTFAEIRLDSPSVLLDILPDGTMNINKLLDDTSGDEKDNKSTSKENGESEKAPPRLFFESIKIVNGHLTFIDHSIPTPAKADLRPINLEISELTTIPERKGPHSFTASLPGGGSLEWAGAISLHPVSSNGKIVVRELKPATAWRFIQDDLNIEEPGGKINIEATYDFNYSNQSIHLIVEPLMASVNGLTMTRRGGTKPILQIQDIALKEGGFNLGKNELNVGSLNVSQGNVVIDVKEDGKLNWNDLIKARGQSQSEPKPKKEGKSFRGTLSSLNVEDIGISCSDKSRIEPMNAELGSFDFRLSAFFEQNTNSVQVFAENIQLILDDLVIKQVKKPDALISLKSAHVKGKRFDLAEQQLDISEVFLSGAHTQVWREVDDALNLVNLFNRKIEASKKPEESVSSEKKEEAPWAITLASLKLAKSSIKVSDRKVGSQLLYFLKNIEAEVKDFSSDPDSSFEFKLALDLDEGGRAKMGGFVNAFAPSVDVTFDAVGLALTPLQPYLDSVSSANLDSGAVSVKGKMQYGTKKPNDVLFSGEVGLEQLRLSETEMKKELLSLGSFRARGVDFSTEKNRLVIDEIVLNEPSGELIIKEDMSTNFQGIFKNDSPAETHKNKAETQRKPKAAKVNREKQAEDFSLEVKRVKVKKGKLDFADLSLRPQFSAKIHDLKGIISGFSNASGRRTSMALEGLVDQYGSTKIVGELEAFNIKNYIDVSMQFRNVDMNNLSPYSGKFAGHEIDSGKLSLDLNYNIKESQLKGENQIIIDQLTLGERVESPTALKIPLHLAIALIKDSNGRIDLGLPVSGDIDDPKFSYGHLIWKVLSNFLTKTVTSPFRALGGLLGISGDDLDMVSFEPGRTKLPPTEREKLVSLTKAFKKRPHLALEVQGNYSSDLDGPILRSVSVRREIAIRSGIPLGKDEEPGPVNCTDPGTQKVLDLLGAERLPVAQLNELKVKYGLKALKKNIEKSSKKGSPAISSSNQPDPIGLCKALFDKLVEIEPLKKSTLTSLAQKRAETIVREFISAGELEPDRFTIAKPAKSGKKDGKLVDCRLKLKELRK